jgi:cytochrome c biogenesis protein CcmG, thiol:disulfide interchange protein DsbE
MKNKTSSPSRTPGAFQRGRPLAGLLLASVMALPCLAIEAGQAAPDFELPGRQGTVHLSDYKGKTVYLDFWASWCGPCKQSFPWMNEMQSRYAAQGFKVVGVNVDQKTADAKTFLEGTPAQFDVAFDQAGKTPRSYAIKGMPTSVLIGPDGKVLMVHSGFKDEQRAEIEQQIRQALGRKGS